MCRYRLEPKWHVGKERIQYTEQEHGILLQVEMIFTYPALPSLIVYGTLPALVGFFLWHFYRDAMAFLAALFMYFTNGLAVSVYLAIMYDDYKKSREYDDRPTQNRFEAKPAPVNVYGRFVRNAQSLPRVRFDARANCAKVLLGQWEHHNEIDVTEDFWLKPIVGHTGRQYPKRWQGTNKEFQEWKRAREGVVFGRENPNNPKSRFIVRDVQALRREAEGR